VLTYTGTGLLPTLVVLVYSKSGALPTLVAPFFTGSGIFGNIRLHMSGLKYIFVNFSCACPESELYQCFGCISGLHLNLTDLMENSGEVLKEFDLSQMCT